MPSKVKKVLQLKQTVYIGPDIEGKITAVIIRPHSTMYEVTWWKDKDAKTRWFGEGELTFKSSKKETGIGFE